MNLLLRLNAVILTVFIAVIAYGTVNTLYDSRTKIKNEVQSSSQIADYIVDSQFSAVANDKKSINGKTIEQQAFSKLDQLRNMQGLKFELYSPDGQLLGKNDDGKPSSIHLPDWLARSLSHFYGSVEPSRRPIIIAGKHVADLVIRPDFDKELATAWNETKSTLMPLVLVFFAGSVFIAFIVSIILKPVLELLKNTEDKSVSRHQFVLFPFLGVGELAGVSRKLHTISDEWQDSSRKLQDMEHKITQIQEEERRRLSAELHDELGQHLTAIRFDTSAIQSSKNLNEAKESASAIDSVSREMTDIVRSMLRRLRPPEIEKLGLKGAIIELVGDWKNRHPENQIELKMSAHDYSQLDDVKQLSVYRIVQECLTNISRHAGRTSVVVEIEQTENRIRVRVSDDGLGCDLTQEAAGFGLKGMRERVEGLGGHFVALSAPAEGMSITAEIPLTKEQ